MMEERRERFATSVTAKDILPASARRTAALLNVEAVVAEEVSEVTEEVVTGEVEEEPPSVTSVTRQDTLPVNAQIMTVGQSATTVTARVILPVNALRVTVPAVGGAAVVVATATAVNATTDLTEKAAGGVAADATTEVDLNATNATGLVTLLGNVGRRRIGATSATEPDTLPGTVTRRRTLATTVTRWAIS